MNKKKIVVCGATGKQGNAVIKSLQKNSEWNIIALSRNPDSEKSNELRNRGIEVRKADLDNGMSLKSAFTDAYGVFGMTQPWSPDYKKINVEAEIKQGYNIADACVLTGVKHLVFTTVLNLGHTNKTGIAHADSKIMIEQYAIGKGIPYTLLRLSQFMDNIGMSYFPVKKGSITGFVDGDAKVPYNACKDVGEFTALALSKPEEYIGKQVNIVGDFISGDELAEVLSRLRNGEEFKYKSIPRFLMWLLSSLRIMPKEFWEMRKGFEKWGRPPYPQAILDALVDCKKIHPGIMTVEQILKVKGYDTKSL